MRSAESKTRSLEPSSRRGRLRNPFAHGQMNFYNPDQIIELGTCYDSGAEAEFRCGRAVLLRGRKKLRSL